MASTSCTTAAAPALRLASLPGPPPTPSSLLDLPQPWLLQLAQCSAFHQDSATLVALFRTCAFFRDAVLRHRTAEAVFHVPIAPENFPAEVERLCTVARRSSRVRLCLSDLERGAERTWERTEPCITHLLVCSMAQLEGEQPLAYVKEIHLTAMEQTSLVPVWVKVLCPNVTKLDLCDNSLSRWPLNQPRPLPHLQQLRWDRPWRAYRDLPLAEHMRQQLAALPSLTSLTLADLAWAQEEEEEEDDDDEEEGQQQQQQAGRLVSSSVTRLELHALSVHASLVRVWFPCLRELDAGNAMVDDDDLEAMLQDLPHLPRLTIHGFNLQRSHAHAAWPWRELTAAELDVDSFARLPLDGIACCSGWWSVVPSSDATAVARVAQAVKRWGGNSSGAGGWWIEGGDFTALLTTLGPVLTALPAAQQRRLDIRHLDDVTPQQVQQLGQHMPPGITTLGLVFIGAPTEEACSALLPSLPASVQELDLTDNRFSPLTEEQVLAVCQAAMRPIAVVVDKHALSDEQLQDIRGRLSGAGWVTLEGHDCWG